MGFLNIVVEHLGTKHLYDKLMYDGFVESLKADEWPSGILTSFQWGPVTVQITEEDHLYGYNLLLPEMTNYESPITFANPEIAAAKALLHIRHLREQAQQVDE